MLTTYPGHLDKINISELDEKELCIPLDSGIFFGKV